MSTVIARPLCPSGVSPWSSQNKPKLAIVVGRRTRAERKPRVSVVRLVARASIASVTRPMRSSASAMRSGMRVLILECLHLTGRDAQAAWDVAGQQERLLRNSGLVVLRTFHASAQALQTSDPPERAGVSIIALRRGTWRGGSFGWGDVSLRRRCDVRVSHRLVE